MRRQNAHQRRRQQELDQARARLIAHLLKAIGPALSAEVAEQILEQAKAWGSLRARELDDHLADNPDALIAPSPHCPLVLVRLLRQLEAAGHGEAVTQLACAICGRTDSTLRRPTPAGRCCNWCLDRDSLKQCARCKQNGHIATHREEEGPICRACYRKDPLFQQDCGKCGRHRFPAFRNEDGTALCVSCYPRIERECARCGGRARVWANTEAGPVCRRCHDVPRRLCGICGRVRQIHVRAANGQPDICDACYKGPAGECSVCGRLRPGFRHRGGAFHCASCQPRPVRQCGDCGKSRQAKSTNWPVGPLCTGCYSRRTRNPIPCSRCRTPRISVGRTTKGGGLCGPCCGLDDSGVACRRCGFPGDIYADGNCTRCVAGNRVRDLLSRDGSSTVASQLRPVADALSSAARPLSVIHWLQHSTSARLLATLAAEHTEITHQLLDGLTQDRNTCHVRETLVATGVLPRRQEILIHLELWLNDFADALPAHQARIVRPFAEWQVLRDARRRSARSRYTAGAATADRTDIRTAAKLLTWLDANQLDLSTLAQEDLDLWLTTHPTLRRGIRSFIRWTLARRLTSGIVLPKEAKTFASRFQTDEEHYDQLRRCLNDDSLPLEVRVVGALVRLYGLPVTRIVALTTDRFHKDKTGAYFTFDRNPVLLPPKLACLIEEQIERPVHVSMLGEPSWDGPRFLLPGRPTSRPRSAGGVHTLMKQHGLPNISARNTAMIEVVAELPPTVVSDLFGVGASTAHRWARFVQDDWADYLAASQEDGDG
ncbi:XRE family transcriptional regulator [Streptomyces goshikiensis]|uniref:XRE family transcriptional regulator n=1 Tax=Streptomyces goshikiensis TaxID=1942 RepID=UPI0033E8884C